MSEQSNPLYTGGVRVTYQGDGATTEFPVPFPVENKEALRVLIVSSGAVTEVLRSTWNFSSGNVTLLEETPDSGVKIVVMRDTPIERRGAYTSGGSLTAASLNGDLDRLTQIAQDLDARTILFPEIAIDAGSAAGSAAFASGGTISGALVVSGGLTVSGAKVATEPWVMEQITSSGGGIDPEDVVDIVSSGGYVTSGAVTEIVNSGGYATSGAVTQIINASGYTTAPAARQIASDVFGSGGTVSGALTVLSGATISGGLFVSGAKVATEPWVMEQITSSGGGIDSETVRTIASAVVSSGGHTVSGVMTFKGGVVASKFNEVGEGTKIVAQDYDVAIERNGGGMDASANLGGRGVVLSAHREYLASTGFTEVYSGALVVSNLGKLVFSGHSYWVSSRWDLDEDEDPYEITEKGSTVISAVSGGLFVSGAKVATEPWVMAQIASSGGGVITTLNGASGALVLSAIGGLGLTSSSSGTATVFTISGGGGSGGGGGISDGLVYHYSSGTLSHDAAIYADIGSGGVLRDVTVSGSVYGVATLASFDAMGLDKFGGRIHPVRTVFNVCCPALSLNWSGADGFSLDSSVVSGGTLHYSATYIGDDGGHFPGGGGETKVVSRVDLDVYPTSSLNSLGQIKYTYSGTLDYYWHDYEGDTPDVSSSFSGFISDPNALPSVFRPNVAVLWDTNTHISTVEYSKTSSSVILSNYQVVDMGMSPYYSRTDSMTVMYDSPTFVFGGSGGVTYHISEEYPEMTASYSIEQTLSGALLVSGGSVIEDFFNPSYRPSQDRVWLLGAYVDIGSSRGVEIGCREGYALVTSGGSDVIDSSVSRGANNYISISPNDGIQFRINDYPKAGFEGGGVRLNGAVYIERDYESNTPGALFVNRAPVAYNLVTSTLTDTSVSFSSIPEGVAYVFTNPMTSIGISSLPPGSHARLKFTAGAGFQLGLPSGAEIVGIDSYSSGSHYVLAIEGGMVVANPYKIVGE